MMKLILAFALVACSALAQAQPMNVCGIPAPNVPYPYIDTVAYACAPTPFGSGTAATVRANSVGVVAWWYCKAPGGVSVLNWSAARADWLRGSTLLADMADALKADDPLAAFNAAAKKNAILPLSDPSLTPVWCPFVQEMVNGTPVPPVLAYVVAKNVLARTRLAYTLAAGKLSPSASRATVGSKCDCASPYVSNAATYCTFSGAVNPATVTVCTPVGPTP